MYMYMYMQFLKTEHGWHFRTIRFCMFSLHSVNNWIDVD